MGPFYGVRTSLKLPSRACGRLLHVSFRYIMTIASVIWGWTASTSMLPDPNRPASQASTMYNCTRTAPSTYPPPP